MYEGKYEQVESREEAAPSPLSAEPNRIEVQEEKTEPEHGEPGEGTKYDEVTDIDREFAEMQQQILSETKAQDPEEHDPPPTISSFTASYYENLKSGHSTLLQTASKPSFNLSPAKKANTTPPMKSV